MLLDHIGTYTHIIIVFQHVIVYVSSFIPESPRWLVQRNRCPEALVILRSFAKWNKTVLNEPELITMIDKSNQKARYENEKLKRYTYLDLFRRRKYCRRALVLMLIW